jgi:hypothetical protein
MYNLAFRYYESELHISNENLALLEEIMTLPIEEAELLVEDELDEHGELNLRA